MLVSLGQTYPCRTFAVVPAEALNMAKIEDRKRRVMRQRITRDQGAAQVNLNNQQDGGRKHHLIPNTLTS